MLRLARSRKGSKNRFSWLFRSGIENRMRNSFEINGYFEEGGLSQRRYKFEVGFRIV
jgi:hypothetical protein